jgi:hypothetical protein
MTRSSLDWLGERSRPHYGQLTLWTLLACALALCAYFQTHHGGPHPRGPRTGPATVLSFLPDAVLLDRRVFAACGLLFAAGAPLWAARRCLPWSAWLATLSFTLVVALYLESSSQATHVAHLTNTLLIVYLMWYQFYDADIRTALREGRFWRTALYPRWAHALSVFAVGLFYGLSGLAKWSQSGLGWPNGTSLQLWATLWGDPESFGTRLILSSRPLAAGLQWATLIGETGGLVAILSTRLRPLVGLLLIGFHAGSIGVFGWGFHANVAILALVFLPCSTWVPRLVARRGGGPRQE